MKYSRASFSLFALVVAPVLLVSTAIAQSYGPGDQVLQVSAAEFRPWGDSGVTIGADGYLVSAGTLESFFFFAPLALPEGALIERLCLYANDSDPFYDVEAHLVAVKLVPGGEESDGLLSLGPSVSSSSAIGFGVYCVNASETIRGLMDVDGDGTLDRFVYYVSAVVPTPTQNSLSLGAVQITWKRQVGAPPAMPTFGDVPPTDPAFPEIEALVASGITAGCGSGSYCPGAPLTRRQMAVFLVKALGLRWAD